MAAEGRWVPSPKMLLNILMTFAITCLAWVFFRAQTFSQALLILKKIALGIWNLAAYHSLTASLAASPMRWRIFLFLTVFIGVEWLQRHHEHPLTLDFWPKLVRWAVYTSMIWMILRYGAGTTSGDFIYFRF